MINNPGSTVNNKTIERSTVVNGTHIRVKSVFEDKIPLIKALGNIVKRKLAAINYNKQ